MKKIFVILSLISSSALFASSFQGYTFTADNSYRTSDGSCIQSVIQVAQVGQSLILSVTSSGTEVIALKQNQLKAFTKLSNRGFGETVTTTVKNGRDILKFKGESCGSLQCDSLTIQHEDGNSEVLEQPIHGLTQVNCNHY